MLRLVFSVVVQLRSPPYPCVFLCFCPPWCFLSVPCQSLSLCLCVLVCLGVVSIYSGCLSTCTPVSHPLIKTYSTYTPALHSISARLFSSSRGNSAMPTLHFSEESLVFLELWLNCLFGSFGFSVSFKTESILFITLQSEKKTTNTLNDAGGSV